ncbi:succinylglutamate desuccinylase [Stutzerimonas stutzeri]|uniref:succinylglutamate desuccinylase n=1 Tax=Stutzerimonas sp. S1 TaxID=3030652 RepID=UPI0022248FCD|nr:succinylglutamate desuccinylase [Stutzerimonas sp. S1]MCW3148944.1 succinylglutamate desuccinylase [Stutzerimonas sp. S1]
MLALGKLLELTLAGREPCEKIQLTPQGVKLRWLAEGAMLVTPPDGLDDGLDLLLSAGIHGNEIIPIQLLDRLVRALARGELLPRARLLVLFGNPLAMRAGKRQLDQDLNRLFCGAHRLAIGAEAARAAALERLATTFFSAPERLRRHYDLHSAMRPSRLPQFAICPWRAGEQVSAAALERLREMGVTGVLFQQQASSTFSAFSAIQLAAEAFTLELAEGDEAWRWLDRLEQSLWGMLEGRVVPSAAAPPLQHFRIAREIIRRSAGFHLCVPPTIENFAPLAQGSVVAVEGDGRQWLVEEAQARLLFPMPDVAPGQRAGLIVVPCE